MKRTVHSVPISTYRLQFTPTFGFNDARDILPYLETLGVGAMYASPYLRARSGSTHGYDIIDHNSLNPEVGTVAEHAAMIADSQARGIGHILDFVPNHMGIGPTNPWWRDVLEWGELSPYASFFDIDWRPLKPELRGKVLVPVLGDHYGRVLEQGEITLAFDAQRGEFTVRYFESAFPLATKSYAHILARAATQAPVLGELAEMFDATKARPSNEGRRIAMQQRASGLKAQLARGAQDDAIAHAISAALQTYLVDPNDPASADSIDELLDDQYYRLSFWRVAVDEINYRRFFDINDLAGLRVEDANVLAQTHRLVFEMIASGQLQGLRIDHIDGLANPGGYANLLQERAAALGQPLYIIAEKILAPFERLRADWSIAGTTGYEFTNLVNGLFIDPAAERAFDRIYERFTGNDFDYDWIAYQAKKRIMAVDLASELTVLATELARIAATDRRSSDFTYNGLRDALTEIVAAFLVYRTYVVSEDIDPEDREFIDAAVGLASVRSAIIDRSVFDFIADILTLRASTEDRNYDRNTVLRFAMRFQQYTGPVMAKSIEDTAFYRYVRLISLNEVGGEPTRFGTSVEEFHAANAERAATRPHTMLATSTHDTKRGEDTRIRIDALTEMPSAWGRAIRRWTRLNRTKRSDVRGYPAPAPTDEYLLYQSIVGTWPAKWRDPEAIPDEAYETYVKRICAYALKAQREAKVRTSWANPDADYEAATQRFIRAILERADEARFPVEIATLVADIAPGAMIESLSQVVLKCTVPGLPDIHQGTELWDHSLVDPDNRQPVDYKTRASILKSTIELPAAARASWKDGTVKLFVTSRLLRLRAKHRDIFLNGAYEALEVRGPLSQHVVAFAREGIVVVVPRLVRSVLTEARIPAVAFGDEVVVLSSSSPKRYRNVFTDTFVDVGMEHTIRVADVLRDFPVAVLEPDA